MSTLNPFSHNAQTFMQQASAGASRAMTDLVGGVGHPEIATKLLWLKVQNQVFMQSYLELIQIMMVIVAFAFIPLAWMKISSSSTVVTDAH
jgi:DHA2 family multidrug resistance protein